MALKDFDWQQFLLKRGEQVGLGISILLMLVLTVMSLFVPEHGFLVAGPGTNAKNLTDIANRVDQKQRSAKPTQNDLPPAIPDVPVSFVSNKVEDATEFQVPERFTSVHAPSSKRRMPDLYQPDEGTAALALSQLRSLIFTNDFTEVKILQGGSGPSPRPAAAPANPAMTPNFPTNNPRFPSGFGAQQGGGPRGNPRLNNVMRPGGMLGAPDVAQGNRQEAKPAMVKTSEITDPNAYHFAETVRPLRQAIIYATFPYKKQIEEFQRKLHLESPVDVLNEQSEEKDEDGKSMPSFRFLGVDVQRRVIGPDGKPEGDGWQTLNLTETLRPFIILCGGDDKFEKDPPELEPLLLEGLAMPLLPQFTAENPADRYPDIEMKLTNVQKTLKELSNKDVEQIIKPKNPLLDKDDFNPFRRRGTSSKPGGGGAPSAGPKGASGTSAGKSGHQGSVVPDHVLVRVVDVTVEPGKVYEYRLHVRMANPNYHRSRDVLSPSYAVDPELHADRERGENDWFVVPQKLSIPPEFYYYVLDQKELDGKDRRGKPNYKGIHAIETPTRDEQVVLQIHRWLDDASRDGGRSFIPVGEWTIAERVLVYRGEFIGRTEKVDVPIWRDTLSAFVLAVPPGGLSRRQKDTGIEVDFRLPNDESILVDFEGGLQHFERKDHSHKIESDTCGTEVLIVSSEGRLTARNSAFDAKDDERVKRLDTWRTRIQDIKGPTSNPLGAPGVNPFGPRIPGR